MIERINSNGFTFDLVSGDLITETIKSRGSWEPHLLDLFREVVKPGSVALDLGANFGFHTLEMSRCVGSGGRVLAFEPQRIIYQQLCHHLFINSALNVWTYNSAVGHQLSTVAVCSPHESIPGNFGATPIGVGSEESPLITIDSLNLTSLGFIKMDVQGAELSALVGAERTIASLRPIVAIEIEESWLRRFNTSSKEVLDWFLARGYVVYRFETEWPTDCFAVPLEDDEQIRQWLTKVAWATTRMHGDSVELTFDGQPYWSSVKLINKS
jgi:FkbM family methyltransferase